MSLQSKYKPISPLHELLAYEALWDRPNSTFRSLSKQLHDYPCLASSLVETQTMEQYREKLLPIIKDLPNFGIRVYGDGEFPERLKDAHNLINILYFQGNWGLTYLPSIAVVGTRQPSQEGIRRTEYLVGKLVQNKFIIVSGLAKGIDTAAHNAAIENNGFTIAVIGTPLNCYYPSENQNLQKKIAKDHLLISQVPFSHYSKQTYRTNRFFFPERNVTMSALTEATIIVEAGETSGSLIQARAALKQGRKLFILENNFLNPNLTWPRKFEEQGAIRLKEYDDLRNYFPATS